MFPNTPLEQQHPRASLRAQSRRADPRLTFIPFLQGRRQGPQACLQGGGSESHSVTQTAGYHCLALFKGNAVGVL